VTLLVQRGRILCPEEKRELLLHTKVARLKEAAAQVMWLLQS
jgi:hypothetical protein